MDNKNKLRNSLIRKIQRLSADKLKEVNQLLSKFEFRFESKDSTLKLAGSWKELDNDLFDDFTSNLHHKRSIDRPIQ